MVKEVFFRTVRKGYFPYMTSKERKLFKNKQHTARIMQIPKEYIGELCLIVPITRRQYHIFRGETKGQERARRFVKVLLENPRVILDTIDENGGLLNESKSSQVYL